MYWKVQLFSPRGLFPTHCAWEGGDLKPIHLCGPHRASESPLSSDGKHVKKKKKKKSKCHKCFLSPGPPESKGGQHAVKQELVKPLILISLLTFLNGSPCARQGLPRCTAELCGGDFYAPTSTQARGCCCPPHRGPGGAGLARERPGAKSGPPRTLRSTPCGARAARLQPLQGTLLLRVRGRRGAQITL